MYFGTRRNLFDKLTAFVTGYETGIWAGRTPDCPDPPTPLVPAGFHEFVWKRVGTGGFGSQGWTSLIPDATQSQEEAFELFFDLREEFERLRNGGSDVTDV